MDREDRKNIQRSARGISFWKEIENLEWNPQGFEKTNCRAIWNLCVSFEADTPGDLETPENPRGRESSGRYLFCSLVFLSLVPGTKLGNKWKIPDARWISNFDMVTPRISPSHRTTVLIPQCEIRKRFAF